MIEECWKFLILGVIQGITEFLPISSTAHLKSIPILLGWQDPGIAITAILQLGSIIAMIIYFQKELYSITKKTIKSFKSCKWNEPKSRLGIAILLGTLPILFLGLYIKLFWPTFEESIFRSIPSIAITSIIMAILLAVAESKGNRKKTIEKITTYDGIFIGFGQALALIPGVSRSGITLTFALLYGWKRADAARFSFLLGIPAISIAGLVEIKDVISNQNSLFFLPLLIGIISSTLVSLLAIDWMIKYLRNNNTWNFIVYRLFFGIFMLSWWSHLGPS